MCAQTRAFPETSDLNSFHKPNSEAFSTSLDTSRRLKRKNTPEYRRIHVYFKSTRQYQRERNRRRKAHELYVEGFTQEKIATKLGVCSKTVAKDLRRTRSYHIGRIAKMLRTIRAERDAEYLQTYDHMSLKDQMKRLEADTKLYVKLFTTRRKLKETITLTVRLDEFIKRIVNRESYGRPFVDLQPNSLMMPLKRFRLHMRFMMNDLQVAEDLYSVGKWGN